jgi:hypothetical protein
MIVFQSYLCLVRSNKLRSNSPRSNQSCPNKSRDTLLLFALLMLVCVCVSFLRLCQFYSSYGFAYFIASFSFFSAFVLLCLFQCFSVFLLCHWFYLSLSLHISEFNCYFFVFCLFLFFGYVLHLPLYYSVFK